MLHAPPAPRFFLSHCNRNGDDALIFAAWFGHLQIVQGLIQAGANVNHANKQGATPLIYAAERGHLDTVVCLCRAGANVHHRDNASVSALVGSHGRTFRSSQVS